MKVVLFCGGLGLRIRDYSDDVPKPMIKVGYRPILWHIMKYYAYYGHRDFILCLGYKADVIKDYFLNYNECLSNNFVLTGGGRNIDLMDSDTSDWRITFVDTGMDACIGERLLAVQPFLEQEEMFMANYADGVTDFYLPDMLARFDQHPDKVACFLSTPPSYTFHVIDAQDDGTVSSVVNARNANLWINGGFFLLRRTIFDFMKPGEDLVEEPFHRLSQHRRLLTYRYDGFWACMDTFKEQRSLDEMYAKGQAQWAIWDRGQAGFRRQEDPVDARRTRL